MAALGVSVCASVAESASLFDPALRFRVLSTEHFRIYFHQGGDRMAARLGSIAESTWRSLERPLGARPPSLTHVVLADQTDLSNGYATPLPYDTIVIYTTWPPGAEFDADDWLRLVFTHEFTHIVHLDRSRGWARAVRGVFGRTLVAFPNLFLPTWQIEGLATYEESAITGEGRLHAGDFRAITDEAARLRAFEPVDRVNGGLTDWPSGQGPYAYGSAFHQYLAERYGIDKLAELANRTAGRVPYTASAVFPRVFGRSLADLWRDFETETAAAAGAASTDAAATRLTRHGFVASGPRFDRFTCASCPPTIVYALRTPDGFPSLARINTDGSGAASIATRYFGSTTALGKDAIYFDQLEVRRNVGLYGDLYALARDSGRVRPITSDARLHDPDLSPDGTTLVCTQERIGQRDLVLVRLKADTTTEKADTTTAASNKYVVSGFSRTASPTIDVLVSEPDTQFNAPRWSPDGRRIAVERHRIGVDPEIVVVDVATRAIRTVAHATATRIVMPAWRPDGRAVVAAVAPDDRVFNVVEFSLDSSASRRLTHFSGGATWPEISADGKTLIFVGYSVGGYDVYSMPYPRAEQGAEQAPPLQVSGNRAGRDREDPVGAELARPPELARPRAAASQDPDGAEQAPPVQASDNRVRADLQDHVGAELARPPRLARPSGAEQAPLLRADDYSPLPTLKPTSWFPVIDWTSEQIRAGAATDGRDVLGYHGYAASATWLVSAPSGTVAPSVHVPDWFVSYIYDRWRPTLFAVASSDTSFFAGPATDAGTPSSATRRERVVEGGVLLPFVHARTSHAALATVFRAVDDYTLVDRELSRERTAIRGAWQTRTAKSYGYSISLEDGLLAGATVEVVDTALGASADATTMTADVRGYLPGLAPHHVLAARFAGGRSTGDPVVGRTFVLGGDAPETSVVDFGSAAASLLRGFHSNSFAGSHVALANIEYRFPLARPQRGVGTWPLFLHTLHAAAFVDAGHAWTRVFRSTALKTSVGGELSANLVAGFYFPVTATFGAAWGHDGSGTFPNGVVAYFRLGKSF